MSGSDNVFKGDVALLVGVGHVLADSHYEQELIKVDPLQKGHTAWIQNEMKGNTKPHNGTISLFHPANVTGCGKVYKDLPSVFPM